MINVETDEEVQFMKLEMLGQYRTTSGDEPVSLDSYEIEYIEHDYSLKALRETTMEAVNSLGDDFSDYLQLPNELPERVGELAETITGSSENVYDKTKAIERYFEETDLSMIKKTLRFQPKIRIMSINFYLKQKAAIAITYSTSMVVMLRTIGIPARWVKRGSLRVNQGVMKIRRAFIK